MPGIPFQSKLEPFYDYIRERRSERWSYRKIAEALGTEHGLKVSANAIFSFVKVRAKRRRVFTLPPRTLDTPADINLNHAAGGFFAPAQPTPYENKNRPYNI